VVFVLDVSGSMAKGAIDGAPSKIDEARAEFESAIRDLPDSAKFNVVLFASGVDSWCRALRRAVPPAKDDARAFVASKGANGSTDLCGGLLAAFGIERVGGSRSPAAALPDQIILLSDGEPTAGLLTDPADIRLEVRRLNRDDAVRIDTVAIGGGPALLLEQIASENGGECVHIDPARGREARAEAAPGR
jgi:Mg-chelatase subunit ChlD